MKNLIQYNKKSNYNQSLLYNHSPTNYTIRMFLVEGADKVTVSEDVSEKFSTDFIIGAVGEQDTAYDWFTPLDMIVHWDSSQFQIMPQSESDYIEMPNVDGSIPENTTYTNRNFNIVLYSRDGLTIQEKYELKKRIVELLDSTKNQYKRLSLQPSENYFDVKYSGSPDIKEGPSFVKATLPFEVKPYGHPFFTQTVTGSGTLTNNGLKTSGPIIKIKGRAENPSFNFGGTTYTWNGTLALDDTLVIDNDSMLCYVVSESGRKTNGLAKLSHDFKKLEPGQSVSISAGSNVNLTATLVESILW